MSGIYTSKSIVCTTCSLNTLISHNHDLIDFLFFIFLEKNYSVLCKKRSCDGKSICEVRNGRLECDCGEGLRPNDDTSNDDSMCLGLCVY